MADPTHPLPSGFPAPLLARALDDALAADAEVPVLAISGLQGSGKSTLAAQLQALAGARGLACTVLSIDDFYLPRAQRRALARRVHPLLATRGPPGTHQVQLALEVIDALRAGRAVQVPRFDKLGDERLPRAQWQRVAAGTRLVVFEGWFLGTPAQAPVELALPLNALERDEDPHGSWRRFCNDALARDYPPLWARADRLWFLQPPGFEVVLRWRGQQERTLQATQPRRAGMSPAQLARFVQHYERVSRQALRTLPALADVVVPLDARRRPGAV
ncbi:MAG: kinase [Pseudoxanthomonas sp.]